MISNRPVHSAQRASRLLRVCRYRYLRGCLSVRSGNACGSIDVSRHVATTSRVATGLRLINPTPSPLSTYHYDGALAGMGMGTRARIDGGCRASVVTMEPTDSTASSLSRTCGLDLGSDAIEIRGDGRDSRRGSRTYIIRQSLQPDSSCLLLVPLLFCNVLMLDPQAARPLLPCSSLLQPPPPLVLDTRTQSRSTLRHPLQMSGAGSHYPVFTPSPLFSHHDSRTVFE